MSKRLEALVERRGAMILSLFFCIFLPHSFLILGRPVEIWGAF